MLRTEVRAAADGDDAGGESVRENPPPTSLPAWAETYGVAALASECVNVAALITLGGITATLDTAGHDGVACTVEFIDKAGASASSYALPGVAHILWAGVSSPGTARNVAGRTVNFFSPTMLCKFSFFPLQNAYTRARATRRAFDSPAVASLQP